MSVAVKEKPILFSGPMVRAILDGRKTMTRRVVKPQPESMYEQYKNQGTRTELWFGDNRPLYQESFAQQYSPYQVGMQLWVRETFRETTSDRGTGIIVYRADDSCLTVLCDNSGEGDPVGTWKTNGHYFCETPWRPSIFMPRWASRITLEITKVRVERLQEIGAKDILSEGAVDRPHNCEYLGKCPVSAFDGCVYPDLISLWAAGWDGINKKRGFSFESNPFVWCISFRKIEGTA